MSPLVFRRHPATNRLCSNLNKVPSAVPCRPVSRQIESDLNDLGVDAGQVPGLGERHQKVGKTAVSVDPEAATTKDVPFPKTRNLFWKNLGIGPVRHPFPGHRRRPFFLADWLGTPGEGSGFCSRRLSFPATRSGWRESGRKWAAFPSSPKFRGGSGVLPRACDRL
jgi:hypothetical protein